MTNRFAVIMVVGAIVFMASAGLAGAYAVAGSGAPSSQNPSVSMPSLPTAMNTQGISNVSNQVDAWTQQHFGFQLSGILTAFLNLLAWVLGLAKNVVDWLLNLINGK